MVLRKAVFRICDLVESPMREMTMRKMSMIGEEKKNCEGKFN
jgi:hypothetical protein